MCSGCSWTYPARYYCSCSQSPDLASPHRVLESSWHLEDATAIAIEYDHTSHWTRRASGFRACRGAVKAHTPCGPFSPHPQCSSLGHRRKLSQNGPWLALRCKSKNYQLWLESHQFSSKPRHDQGSSILGSLHNCRRWMTVVQ